MAQLLGAQYRQEDVDRHMERLRHGLEPDDCPLTTTYHAQTPRMPDVNVEAAKLPNQEQNSERPQFWEHHGSLRRYVWYSDKMLRLRERLYGRPWKNITGPERDLAHIVIRTCIKQEAPQHHDLCKDDIQILRIYPSGCLALTRLYRKGGLREDEIGCRLPFPAPTFKVGHSGRRSGNMTWFIAAFFIGELLFGGYRRAYVIRVGIAEETIEEWHTIGKLAEDTRCECIWDPEEDEEEEASQ